MSIESVIKHNLTLIKYTILLLPWTYPELFHYWKAQLLQTWLVQMYVQGTWFILKESATYLCIFLKTRQENNTTLHLYRALGLQNGWKASVHVQRYAERGSAYSEHSAHSTANSEAPPAERTPMTSGGPDLWTRHTTAARRNSDKKMALCSWSPDWDRALKETNSKRQGENQTGERTLRLTRTLEFKQAPIRQWHIVICISCNGFSISLISLQLLAIANSHYYAYIANSAI